MFESRALLAILLLGLAVHLASIPLLGGDPLSGDALQFSDEADAILDGKGWINTEGEGQATTTYPTQIMFLLLCKFVFGKTAYVAPVIIQHLLVLATAFMVFRIALLLRFGNLVALIATAIMAFFPHMIFLANVLISHTLGMFLSVLGIYLLLRKPIHPTSYLLIGIVWGLATLARFTFQYFVPVWVIAMLVTNVLSTRRLSRVVVLRSVLAIVGFMVVLTPWYMRVHKYEGGNSGYTEAWRICYSFNREPALRGNDRDEFQLHMLADESLRSSDREQIYRRKVFENLRSHPQWFVNNALTNISFLLINVSTEEQPHSSIYVGIYLSMLLGFGVVGMVSLGREHHTLLVPVYLLSLVIMAVHVPIYGYVANSVPIWVCMMPVVARGIVIAMRGAVSERRRANLEVTESC